MLARFDESLRTGNAMIDEQHRELIEKINQLVQSCEQGREKGGDWRRVGLYRSG